MWCWCWPAGGCRRGDGAALAAKVAGVGHRRIAAAVGGGCAGWLRRFASLFATATPWLDGASHTRDAGARRLQQAAGANEIITYSQDPVLRKDGEDFEVRPGLRSRTGWRLRSRRSVTVRMDPKVGRTLTTIDEDSWVPIKYLRRADRQLDLRRRDH